MRLKKLVERAKDLVQFLRTGSVFDVTVFEAPRQGDFDDGLDDLYDPDYELDCTGKIHRRHCRKFDRQIRELYWLSYDEVVEDGQYLKFRGSFYVPTVATIFKHEGQLVELIRNVAPELPGLVPVDPKAIYLGPLPTVPPSLEIE